MAFPVAAAIGVGASAAGKLFGKKKRPPPRAPEFFVNNPDELRALLRQSTQSEYAGLESRLRENLSNAGVLSPSSLSGALTQGSIALGQETLGKFSDLGLQELDRARALQSQEYLMRLEDSLGYERETERDIFAAVGGLGKGIGDIIGQSGGVEGEEDVLDQIMRASKKKKTAPAYTPDSALYGGYA